jgi:hypothetical protein
MAVATAICVISIVAENQARAGFVRRKKDALEMAYSISLVAHQVDPVNPRVFRRRLLDDRPTLVKATIVDQHQLIIVPVYNSEVTLLELVRRLELPGFPKSSA